MIYKLRRSPTASQEVLCYDKLGRYNMIVMLTPDLDAMIGDADKIYVQGAIRAGNVLRIEGIAEAQPW